MKLQFKGHTILLDKEDYCYFTERSFYISRRPHTKYLYNRSKNILFHRLIMNCPNNKQVDHINGNGLDNRKCNLRIVTISQNHQNRKKQNNASSKYKGVHFDNSRNKWLSKITINGKQKHLGYFEREQEAAKAYNYMALKYFGEYAKLNKFD